MNVVRRFILDDKLPRASMTAVSLFSAAGLSDFGYRKAGFDCKVHAELDPYRAAIGQENFPESTWIVGDIRTTHQQVIDAYKASTSKRLSLLVATPPCQGMSSSNPTRGKRSSEEPHSLDEKNALILEIIPIAKALKPRIIVAENVRQLLTQPLTRDDKSKLVIDAFQEGLPTYEVFTTIVDVADYGMPQTRKRSVLVAVDKSEAFLAELRCGDYLPWPRATHGTSRRDHISVTKWLTAMKYPPLDSASPALARNDDDPLHFVPSYDPDRYLQVSGIPPMSGKSAYQNDSCPDCSKKGIPEGLIRCPKCAGLLRNRPYVYDGKQPRLIAGFKSSYRRMAAHKPASTVTTNSSHVGSDIKIHPFENRVLSARECAELQSVPRMFKWDKPLRDGKAYSVRSAVGEAFPPFFTFLHGKVLSKMLREKGTLSPQLKARLARR